MAFSDQVKKQIERMIWERKNTRATMRAPVIRMRADLQHSQAAIDWTLGQLAGFEERLNAWIDENVEAIVIAAPEPYTCKGTKVVERAPFPLAFSVEAGAYVNTLRSSLDILAMALAERKAPVSPKNERSIYFPMADEPREAFEDRIDGIDWFAERDKDIIKAVQPYPEGNARLYHLHRLDIVRKHRRLLKVGWDLASSGLSWSGGGGFTIGSLPPPPPEWKDDPTIIDWINTIDGDVETLASFWAVISEPGPFVRKTVIEVLRELAGVVEEIVARFDYE